MPPKQNQQLTVKLQTSRGKELSRSGTPQDVHDGTGAPEEPIEAGQRRSLSVPRHLDVRRLVVAGVDKRGRALKPFESLHDASRERSARIRTLRCTGDARDGELAEILSSCSRRRCQSTACPVCGRERRVVSSASILAFLLDWPLHHLHFLTLINPVDAIPAGQLQASSHRSWFNGRVGNLSGRELIK